MCRARQAHLQYSCIACRPAWRWAHSALMALQLLAAHILWFASRHFRFVHASRLAHQRNEWLWRYRVSPSVPFRSRGAVAERAEFNGKLTLKSASFASFLESESRFFFRLVQVKNFAALAQLRRFNSILPTVGGHFFSCLFVIFFSIPWLLSKCVRINGVPFNERHCGIQVSQP